MNGLVQQKAIMLENDTHGFSIGKTQPAIPTALKTVYPENEFTVKSAAAIPCEQVLEAYTVRFERCVLVFTCENRLSSGKPSLE